MRKLGVVESGFAGAVAVLRLGWSGILDVEGAGGGVRDLQGE